MPPPIHARLRLGNRRREMLVEAANGRCIISTGQTRDAKSARWRAAQGLVRAGLALHVKVRDLDALGRVYNLVAIELTGAGVEVALTWYPELRDGGTIRWKRHARLAARAMARLDRVHVDQNVQARVL